MAHHFLQAPDNYSVEQALRWGQMKALGCADAAINAIAASRLGRSLLNEDSWFTVLRFIADNPKHPFRSRSYWPVNDWSPGARSMAKAVFWYCCGLRLMTLDDFR
ncbi:hypothetical protein [Parasphingorhabdus marina]|uniref:hypothetical protein n=1 Tax=Parasphingorhabdus marina TaxID=394732 RepID=UPI000940B541|nr:hypothetical protein [Parasphingorhabdus marina]